MTRDEAQSWLAEVLMQQIRSDRFPSATHMSIVEEVLPRERLPEYLAILMEKVDEDAHPSIPMLRRISRLTASLPAY